MNSNTQSSFYSPRSIYALALTIVALLSLTLVGCSKDKAETLDSSSTVPQISTSGESISTSTTLVFEPDICNNLSSQTIGTVQDNNLIEVSGLSVSQRHSEVLWTHNDGSIAGVHAIQKDGKWLRFFDMGVDPIDVEAMTLYKERVYLADIGDNFDSRVNRDFISIISFSEPDPFKPQPIDDVIIHRFVYPDGDKDAEAFFIDPRTERFVIIEKNVDIISALRSETGDAGIYTAPISSGIGTNPTELDNVGAVPLDYLDELSIAPIPEGKAAGAGLTGVATGADISSDGSVIAIRTYETVWLFPRSLDQTLVQAFENTPCEAPTVLEKQGEAVVLLPSEVGQVEFITIGEGANPSINLTK